MASESTPISRHPVRALALTVLLTTGCAEEHVVRTTAEDLEHIRASTERYVAAVRAGEFKAVTEFYTVDAVVMPPNEPPVEGRKAIEAWFARQPPVEDLTLQILEVDGHEDLVFVRGRYVLAVGAIGNQPARVDTGKYLEVRHRVPGGDWLITVDMFSSDLPLATARAAGSAR